jgi:uncharacterized membrane protein YphA (DoxX/SURF4 family)
MIDTASQTTETQSHEKKSGARIATAIVRILLGLAFLCFGVMGLFNLLKPPPDTPPEILTVSAALATAGYMKVVGATEIFAGLLLLTNRFVPLALALLAPIVVGILTFHVAMQLATMGPGIVVAAMELHLAWSYRGAFKPMLRAKTTPGAD